jgi:dipeptidyl-peptidase III
MKRTFLHPSIIALAITMGSVSCADKKAEPKQEAPKQETNDQRIIGEDGKLYQSEQFADYRILHYYIPQWDSLDLRQKELVYYLYEAGLAGRDIMWDQNCKYNLPIRHALEKIVAGYAGDKNDANFKNLELYLKQMWVHTGVHHHYGSNKITPAFDQKWFDQTCQAAGINLSDEAKKTIFDPNFMAMKVESDTLKDLVSSSAVNFYEGVSDEEVEAYYAAMKKPNDRSPLEYGLNSKLVKENGQLVEKKWMIGGTYGPALEKVVYWLEKAQTVAENDKQALALKKLIEYYRSGDLQKWADFNLTWIQATEGDIDFIQGFVETYNDPLGMRGSYESVVEIKDFEASARMKVMMNNAQWFEDNSSTAKEFKKEKVTGITYNIVNVWPAKQVMRRPKRP